MAAILLVLLSAAQEAEWRATLDRYCVDCHDPDAAKGQLDLETALGGKIGDHADVWEKVVRRLRTRQMPPPKKKKRPSEAQYEGLVAALEARLDAAAAAHPDPGRTDTIRRLTRVEYTNAIRDLLGLEIDAAALLPDDESSHGFDSGTTGTLSPTLLERYLSAAQKISRLALGRAGRSPDGATYRIPPDVTQEERVEGLPPGTRGGLRVRHTFPVDGDYEIRIRLMRDRNEEVEGLKATHELEVLLDRAVVTSFKVHRPKGAEGHAKADAHLVARIRVAAGPHDLGVTFLKKPSGLVETLRQPYHARFNVHRHPRLGPAIFQVSVTGPYNATAAGDSPSRRRILRPGATAERVLTDLMRRAFRRPPTKPEIARVLDRYRAAREEGGEGAGIEAALAGILMSHGFLFRVERDPEGLEPKTPYALDDFALASRLSFFLWSSIPDDVLLDLAERGELSKPGALRKQALRMLADPKAATLATHFAAQWLHLRNLDSITPDRRLFPDFDDNLRRAMRRETELLFEEILREDRSVTGLLKSDHAWLNERLAKHYGIPHVYGTRFRRVALEPGSRRGGLLRQGSILTVTSYATRTSPVLRGKWVMNTLLGTPPPPPLPDVPALDDNVISSDLPVRERLQAHRANPACAVCHDRIDPLGFALENFDPVGRWRTLEKGKPVDASGGLGDGTVFTGVGPMEEALLKRPGPFVTAMTGKLLTFALGRAMGPHDAAAVRGVVRGAAKEDYRLSSLVGGIVESIPFRMRRTE